MPIIPVIILLVIVSTFSLPVHHSPVNTPQLPPTGITWLTKPLQQVYNLIQSRFMGFIPIRSRKEPLDNPSHNGSPTSSHRLQQPTDRLHDLHQRLSRRYHSVSIRCRENVRSKRSNRHGSQSTKYLRNRP